MSKDLELAVWFYERFNGVVVLQQEYRLSLVKLNGRHYEEITSEDKSLVSLRPFSTVHSLAEGIANLIIPFHEKVKMFNTIPFPYDGANTTSYASLTNLRSTNPTTTRVRNLHEDEWRKMLEVLLMRHSMH